MKKGILVLLVILPLLGLTQEEKKFGIKFHGFVKSDIFWDTRQTVDAREGHFLLYPQNESLDINGDDINATSKFNILSIQTRLKGVISGPDVWGAKTSGLIEGAFFGNIGTDINGFRLRHAFVKLTWEKSELLVGQFWHPMFVTSCFPGTVSFNTGTPFQPFARNPQIRFTKRFGKFNLIGTVIEQVDFVDKGPAGVSRSYLINNAFPEMNLRFEFKSESLLIGAGLNYKSLLPRMSLTNTYDVSSNIEPITYKLNEKVTGTGYFGYFKYMAKPITVKLYGVLGQMMFSMTNIGGYAETEIVREQIPVIQPGPGPIDTAYKTTNIKYSPTTTMSFWTDIHTNGKTWQFGLFGGYSKNKGSKDIIVGDIYSRGSNIDYAYRISPRVIYNNGKFRIAPEIEYTVAAYGTPDEKGIVKDSKEIANFRFLIGVYFFF
ncbi:MAG: hypothetical protein B6D61_09950 [Bacteroidetes bacterium 4484_249]|nr:MAG: hypothetical protein B6D61_09950 [Bacteroidetes bacterium 4484_249]